MMKWLLLLGLLLPGCISSPATPKFMQPGAIESIVIGKTTMAEIRDLLGRPQEVRIENEATGSRTLWRYQYVQRGRRELVPGLQEALSRPAIRAILAVHLRPMRRCKKLNA